MPKMNKFQRASALTAMNDWTGSQEHSGSGYNLIRYARKGFLEPNPNKLSILEQIATQQLLDKIPSLPTNGPLPELHIFLGCAAKGDFRVVPEKSEQAREALSEEFETFA